MGGKCSTYVARRKNRWYRQRIRDRAIKIMGGKCERCGIDDPLVLQIDHRVALRRGGNGLRSNQECSDKSCMRILRGEKNKFQLLCANCHVRKTRLEDSADIHRNLNGRRLDQPDPQLKLLWD